MCNSVMITKQIECHKQNDCTIIHNEPFLQKMKAYCTMKQADMLFKLSVDLTAPYLASINKLSY